MNPQTKAEFEKLLSKSPNKTCIDCDTFNPQWASVNNGCFMCIKCAGNHRSMGVHITFVRSVTMDGWSKIQLARMKNGGNGKLKKFWKSQQFPKNLTPKQRLDNVAMDKYRERLLSLAKGESPPDIPFIGYQERQILNKSSSDLNRSSFANSSSSSLHSNGSNYSNQSNNNNNNGNRPKMQGFGNTNYNPNDNNNNNNDGWDDFWNSASSFAAKATAVTSDLAQKSKVAAVSLGNKAAEKTATIKNKLGDEEYQANLKKNAAETWSKTTTTLSSWWSTAATSVTNAINENLGDKDGVTLYNRDGIDENKQQQQSQQGNALYNNNNPNRKKMAALSSDQYFNRTQPQQSQSYGSATNENNNDKGRDNIKKINVAKEEDILGIDNNAQKINKKNIDDLEAWNKKSSKKKKKVKTPSDDFDDWGFGDDSDNDKEENNNNDNSKAKKPEIKPVIDITQAINGVDIDGNNKKKEKKVESLLDFDKNDNNDKGNDGNSSDELDAFFNEMENEKDDDTQNKDKNQNKNNNNKESNESTMDTNDIDDLLTSHNQNDKNEEPDEWGW